MELATEYQVQSIAIPAISCGIYRYPADQAAKISISTIKAMLEASTVKEVIFAILEPTVADAYMAELSGLAA
jgi:O-acetyl-ADP-ribose deacetylase